MADQVSPAPQQQESPIFPPGMSPLIFDTFLGMNTTPSRPGIADQECYWIDGFIPRGKNNLRALYGLGASIYTAPEGMTIVWFEFGNLGETPLCILMLSDGSLLQINTSTYAATTIAAAGTISNPSVTGIGLSQWGSEYIIIVADQPNGYWLWDGTNLATAGTLGLNVTVTDGGSGYTSVPTVTPSGGSGSGATFTAVLENEIVVSVTVDDPGSGYLVGETVTLGFTGGGGSGATAEITIMPFGIQGSDVEIYTSRVWVANGGQIFYSAPGTPSDFESTNGGGNFTSNDSFLRVGFSALIQSNGFLYLIGDSSINYISGVQTGGTPVVTTFTNQNADPEIGTPFSPTVDVLSRNIVFANAFGVHVSYGGAVTKVSEALDGIYNTVPDFGGFTPSAAKAIIFGKKVWMLLLPIIDPITGQQVNKLLMWDQKNWWASEQDIDLTYVQHQEINSVITAYGTDGLSVYPLFKTPSVGFTKRVQSKLWDTPGTYATIKTATRLFGLANYYSTEGAELTISVDNENTASSTDYTFAPNESIWTNAQGDVVDWINDAADIVPWYTAGGGVVVFPPQAVGQQGALTGLTLETQAADVAIISLMLIDSDFQYRG